MKYTSFGLKVIAIATLASVAGLAAAAGTNTLTVNASVTAKCTFSSGTSTLNFGAIDPSSNTAATATASSVGYKCTKGTTATISPAGATSRTLTAPSGTMAYTLTVGAGTVGTGFSTAALSASLNGTIPVASFQDATADTYVDTVTLNITP